MSYLTTHHLPSTHIHPNASPCDVSLSHLFRRTLRRPLRLLFTDPITASAAAYNGFIYGLIFLFNESFPYIYTRNFHFSRGQTSLTFLTLVAGSLLGLCLHPLQERYFKQHPHPASRMFTATPLSFLLPLSIFVQAVTSKPPVSPAVPLVMSTLFGFSTFASVLAILNFVTDAYGGESASALAGVVLVRNLVGAAFPLLAGKLYGPGGLGVEKAGLLMGGIGVAVAAVPGVLFWWGEELCAWSARKREARRERERVERVRNGREGWA
jgi:hypothetical protein